MRFLDMLDAAMARQIEEKRMALKAKERLERKAVEAELRKRDRVFCKEGMDTMRVKLSVIRRRRIA